MEAAIFTHILAYREFELRYFKCHNRAERLAHSTSPHTTQFWSILKAAAARYALAGDHKAYFPDVGWRGVGWETDGLRDRWARVVRIVVGDCTCVDVGIGPLGVCKCMKEVRSV